MVTERSKGTFDFSADLLAGINVLEHDFFETGEVLVTLRNDNSCTSFSRLLNP